MSTGSGGEGEGISEVLRLVPYVSGLITIASDPREWLLGILLPWIVERILEAARYVLGWMVFFYEETASILLTATEPLTAPANIIEGFYVFVIETIFGGLRDMVLSMGLAAPIASAVALVIVLGVFVTIVYASISVIPGSDSIPAITERFQR
ncbi:hypothetical protein GWK26_11865 [haloarchaeon 3A1-DGR]|nr:hypothetical protein GWK26_11865 [haloarchaeon 3A1-DGR]